MGSKDEPFLFNFALASEGEKDVDLRIEAMTQRIDKLVRSAEINGHPIAQHILAMTHDCDELVMLGKVLQRLGPLAKEMDDLMKKKSVFELAKEHPEWLQVAFGDYTAELDAFVRKIEDGNG